jgi:hypothetical protein
MRDETIFEI